MPRITPSTNIYATPERDHCLAVAKAAAGDDSNLNEDQIKFLAEVGMDPERSCVIFVRYDGIPMKIGDVPKRRVRTRQRM